MAKIKFQKSNDSDWLPRLIIARDFSKGKYSFRLGILSVEWGRWFEKTKDQDYETFYPFYYVMLSTMTTERLEDVPMFGKYHFYYDGWHCIFRLWFIALSWSTSGTDKKYTKIKSNIKD